MAYHISGINPSGKSCVHCCAHPELYSTVESGDYPWVYCTNCLSGDDKKRVKEKIIKDGLHVYYYTNDDLDGIEDMYIKQLSIVGIGYFNPNEVAKASIKNPDATIINIYPSKDLSKMTAFFQFGDIKLEFNEKNLRWAIGLLDHGWLPTSIVIPHQLSIEKELVRVMQWQPSIVKLQARLSQDSWDAILSTNEAIECVDERTLDRINWEHVHTNRSIWSASKHRGIRIYRWDTYHYWFMPMIHAMVCFTEGPATWLPRDVIEQDILPHIYAALMRI